MTAKARRRWIRAFRKLRLGLDESPEEMALWEAFNALASAYVVRRGFTAANATMCWDCGDECMQELAEMA